MDCFHFRSWFKIFRFLALTSMMALGFIYLMNVLISHAPESWTTPMEPGRRRCVAWCIVMRQTTDRAEGADEA